MRPRDPVPRPGTTSSDPVSRVGKLTAIERKTAAADALGEPCFHSLEFGDAVVDASGPAAGQLRPIAAFWNAVTRQFRELDADLFQRKPDPLGEDNKCDAAEYAPWISAVTGIVPL